MSDSTITQHQTAIVLLHGMFGSPENWRACVEELSGDFRVLAPRLPLFDAPMEADPIGALLDFVRAQLDKHGITRAIVAGNSLGGHVAARLALCEPERVSALVLTGSSGLFERVLGVKVQRRPTREWLRSKAAEVFFDPRHVTEEMMDEIEAVVRSPRAALRLLQLARAAKRDCLRPLLPRICCPAALVWGADDQITPPSAAFEFHDLLPHSELCFLRQCGHAPMMERPEEFNRVMRRFANRVAMERDAAASRQWLEFKL